MVQARWGDELRYFRIAPQSDCQIEVCLRPGADSKALGIQEIHVDRFITRQQAEFKWLQRIARRRSARGDERRTLRNEIGQGAQRQEIKVRSPCCFVEGRSSL